MVHVVVLGNAGEYLKPLSGGSGYLFEGHGARILLDCGPGIGRALATRAPETLDAVVLSHFHFDHALELIPVTQALAKGTPLFVPPGSRGNLAALARAYHFEGAFEPPGPLTEARAGEVHNVGKVRVDFLPTQHSAPAMATRIRTIGRTFVYASDTAPFEALTQFAHKADLLVAHTLLPTVEAESEHARIHMTAQGAGELAAAAGVKRLALSHRFWESQDEEMLAAARASFPNAELGQTDQTYELG